MGKAKLALLGLVALGGCAVSTIATAMPVAPLSDPTVNIEPVHWVCGPYRCFWRPNYYSYGYYGPPRVFPRFYGRPYGWGGGWRGGWHRW